MESKKYTDYINEHRKNVCGIWRDIGLTLKEKFNLDNELMAIISDLILEHDRSKFSEEEFSGYCQWFYTGDGDDKDKESFDRAWNHHQKANPHHWQYWLMYERGEIKALDMPIVYIIEMLCDWSAMACKFKDTPCDFYEKNKGAMFLSNRTRENVERYIECFNNLFNNDLR